MLCSFFTKTANRWKAVLRNTLCRRAGRLRANSLWSFGHGRVGITSFRKTAACSRLPTSVVIRVCSVCQFNEFRTSVWRTSHQTGGQIKYGHSEVGNFTLDGKIYEQNEIEFLPVRAEQAADQLMIAKWIIRNLAYQYGYDITFAPKITAGKAGSGLHIHMRIMKDGKNQMLKDGVLSETARKAIAGMMELAPSITAFGNTNPTSYFRLVPHQEAPTNICWGDRNRSVDWYVPLGMVGKHRHA